MTKWWTVTTHYPMTSMSVAVVADNEPHAHDTALQVMVDEWGEGARKYDDVHISEQGYFAS